MKLCKQCGKEIDEKAVICVHCGCPAKVKKPLFKRVWFWLIVVFAFLVICISSCGGDTTSETGTNNTQNEESGQTAPSIPEEFAQPCPVSVSASVSNNIIGVPELKVNVRNNTDKEIAAIQFYFLPKDVYGDDVNTVLTSNKLYTDEPIGVGGSCSRSWQMLDQNIKGGTVYVYSVYYTDGTEWGDKDASTSRIKQYGLKISAES